jgi:hypothetical protein
MPRKRPFSPASRDRVRAFLLLLPGQARPWQVRLWGVVKGHITSIFKNSQQRHCEPTGRNDVAPILDTTSRSRGAKRPSRAFIFRPKEGVGNAGCPLHPRPRVHFVLVESTRVTTSTPESPGIPARNGFTAYVALSPVTGLFCHRRQRIKFCLSPVGPTQLRKLDASVGASGPHDFAVRNNISRPRAVDRSQAEACPAIPSHAKRCRVHRIRTPRP